MTGCQNYGFEEPNDKLQDCIEYVNLDFNITADGSEVMTRCLPSSNTTESNNLFGEACMSNKYYPLGYKLIILMNDKVVSADSLVRFAGPGKWLQTEIPDFSGHPYISYVKETSETSISFGLKFAKTIDPSNIRLICMASRQNSVEQFRNWDPGNSINDVFIESSSISQYCNFLCNQKLSDTNSWNDVNTRMVLKRNSAQILIFHPEAEVLSAKYKELKNQGGSIYSTVQSFAVFNFTNAVTHLMSSSPGASYPIDTYISDYYFNGKKTVMSKNNVKGFSQYNSSLGVTYGVLGTEVTYNGKKYGFFAPLDICTNTDGSLPITEDNEEFKYITLALYHYDNTQSGKDRNDYKGYCYWTNISIAGQKLEPNKRYILILKADTPLWQNYTEKYITRGTVEEDFFEALPNSCYEIIEQEMDDPLPFNIEYDNSSD